MGAPTPLPANGSVAACCTACSAAKACDGWALQNSTAERPECVLLRNGTLVNNPEGIVSAQKEDRAGLLPRCWYDSSSANKTWAPFCSAENCSCDAIDRLSIGVENHAMCFDRGPPHNRTLRATNAMFWWNYTGADCDSGVEDGGCSPGR
jgi:hypothetical protein